jgi:hypothetical protein
MNVLATLLLAISLSGGRPLTLRSPVDLPAARQTAHKGGKWYFADTGHAVYCYGPVMIVKEPEKGVERVATFCEGDKAMVPLRD